MWTFLSKSIARRFNAVILTVITLSLISFTLMIGVYNYNRTISDLEEAAKGTIELAKISLRAPIWHIDELALKDILRAIMLDKNISAIRVTEKKSTYFADIRKYLDYEKKRKHLESVKFDDLKNRNEYLYNKAAVIWEDEIIGYVHILTSKTKAYDLIKVTSISITIFALALLLFMGLVVWLTTTRVIKIPITRLKESATGLAQGILDKDIDISRIDELGSLARSFSEMRDSIRKKIADLNTLNSKNIQMYKQIEEQNRTLEQKVLERTAQLEERTIEIQKKNKELLIAKEAAEDANNSKSEFLVNMSHEIRTPMNAVLGFSEILFGKEDDEQKKNYLASILSSGKSLLSLINDILDLSKVDAGKLELEYSAVSLYELFKEMQIVFGQKVIDNGLKLFIDIAEEVPESLILDETRLRQILINLTGNAVKFTNAGHIRLSANISYLENNQRSCLDLIISVEDTGMGIPEDQHEYIFRSFNQQKGQKSSDFGGTGLGLSISRGLVEIMNGQIFLTSLVGKGSTFKIILKNVEVASVELLKIKRAKQLDFSLIKFEKRTVLIVDDIEFNRELLKGFLEDYNLDLLEAENGLEALEKVNRYSPHLILLDMKMPVMDGYETATTLQNHDTLNNIPVIAVTASAMKKDEEVISELCDSYLKKPVSKTELILEIMKFLPHTIKTDSEESVCLSSDNSQILSPIKPEHYPELIDILKNEQTRCRQLSKLMAINKIEAFAKEMKELGKRFDFKPLISFGSDLSDSTHSFDTEKIQQHLNNFHDFLE